MIETLDQIDRATKNWLRWILWIPRSRRIARELAIEARLAGDWKHERIRLIGAVSVRDDELASKDERISNLRQEVKNKSDAIDHLTNWIKASTRNNPATNASPIKQILSNALQSRRK